MCAAGKKWVGNLKHTHTHTPYTFVRTIRWWIFKFGVCSCELITPTESLWIHMLSIHCYNWLFFCGSIFDWDFHNPCHRVNMGEMHTTRSTGQIAYRSILWRARKAQKDRENNRDEQSERKREGWRKTTHYCISKFNIVHSQFRLLGMLFISSFPRPKLHTLDEYEVNACWTHTHTHTRPDIWSKKEATWITHTHTLANKRFKAHNNRIAWIWNILCNFFEKYEEILTFFPLSMCGWNKKNHVKMDGVATVKNANAWILFSLIVVCWMLVSIRHSLRPFFDSSLFHPFLSVVPLFRSLLSILFIVSVLPLRVCAFILSVDCNFLRTTRGREGQHHKWPRS